MLLLLREKPTEMRLDALFKAFAGFKARLDPTKTTTAGRLQSDTKSGLNNDGLFAVAQLVSQCHYTNGPSCFVTTVSYTDDTFASSYATKHLSWEKVIIVKSRQKFPNHMGFERHCTWMVFAGFPWSICPFDVGVP